jgi:hypothetical protein
MSDSRKNGPFFKKRFLALYEFAMPEESEGPCRKCKEFKILGNGYCIYCWDKLAGAVRSYAELE